MKILSLFKQIYNAKINRSQFAKVNSNIAQNVTIHGVIGVYGNGKIIIDGMTRINSGEMYNPIGGATRTIFFVKNGGKIVIKKNVGISNSTFVARSEIIIEDDVLVGGDCKIYDNDFHSLDYDKRIFELDDDVREKPVKICKGAFIGAHTIILKGVIIGEKAIVGAGSVVTKSVPAEEVWAGNPAHFIRKV